MIQKGVPSGSTRGWTPVFGKDHAQLKWSWRLIQRSWIRRRLSRLRQLLEDSAEANAALAGARGCFPARSRVGVGTGKADAALVAAEHRPLAAARGVLVIDDLALPPAVAAGV